MFAEEDIIKRWNALLSKFKEERKKLREYQPSGSAAQKEESAWEFYSDMEFIIPYIEHRDTLSSFDDENSKEEFSNKEQIESLPENPKKQYKRKRGADDDDDDLKKILESNNNQLKKLEEPIKESTVRPKKPAVENNSQELDNYMMLIQKGFEALTCPKIKFQCSRKIFSYIKEFKNKQ